jgi:hypothetical protein
MPTFIFKDSRSVDLEDERWQIPLKCQEPTKQQRTVTYQKTGILLTIILKYQLKLILESKTQSLARMKRTA